MGGTTNPDWGRGQIIQTPSQPTIYNTITTYNIQYLQLQNMFIYLWHDQLDHDIKFVQTDPGINVPGFCFLYIFVA